MPVQYLIEKLDSINYSTDQKFNDLYEKYKKDPIAFQIGLSLSIQRSLVQIKKFFLNKNVVEGEKEIEQLQKQIEKIRGYNKDSVLSVYEFLKIDSYFTNEEKTEISAYVKNIYPTIKDSNNESSICIEDHCLDKLKKDFDRYEEFKDELNNQIKRSKRDTDFLGSICKRLEFFKAKEKDYLVDAFIIDKLIQFLGHFEYIKETKQLFNMACKNNLASEYTYSIMIKAAGKVKDRQSVEIVYQKALEANKVNLCTNLVYNAAKKALRQNNHGIFSFKNGLIKMQPKKQDHQIQQTQWPSNSADSNNRKMIFKLAKFKP